MRRKDREMSRDFGLDLIDRVPYGVLSLVDEDRDRAYSLPLSLVREGEVLYFHSAQAGRKVDLLAKNPQVGISFVGQVQVPENFTPEELEALAQDKQAGVKLISSVFTTEFESVFVEGEASPVADREEKIHALYLICKKYTPDKLAYFDLAISSGLPRVQVYRVDIQSLTAKRKKYDASGKEMKWGRME
ncbi:MAG: pyridoxamine 5'-phosphate oxidase family protein [Tissierellia bacterium]|nr:pyridoxamine 5'-phosphate oxidase family protein [Tissierellia bacterium]